MELIVYIVDGHFNRANSRGPVLLLNKRQIGALWSEDISSVLLISRVWGHQSSVAKYKDYPSDYVLMDPADLGAKKCEILQI